MQEKNKEIIDAIRLPEGMEVDIREGWKKLISSQFGGEPGRAFSELIQNALDSYPSEVPFEQRQGKIETTSHSISIEDYGVGLSREKIILLTTLGGTDKKNDPTKIGRFGIGFFSNFNPRLGTKEICVETNCEGLGIRLVFTVEDPDLPPNISVHFLEQLWPFSTRVTVTFNYHWSVADCLNHARKSLKYYPCRMEINGMPQESIWQTALDEAYAIKESGAMRGFMEPNSSYRYYASSITFMCKFEYLGTYPVEHWIKGGRNLSENLKDYYTTDTPYYPDFNAIVNTNDLTTTISRDGWMLDYKFTSAVHFLNDLIWDQLAATFPWHDTQVLLANSYIFRHKLRAYLQAGKSNANDSENKQKVIQWLCDAKIYRVKDRWEKFSLLDIQANLSEGLPLFYSSDQENENWLGGAFKHDFILLPARCTAHHGAPGFYQDLFTTCFQEAINLDTIQENAKLIKDLVDRKIIKKSSLVVKCKFVGNTRLDENQAKFLLEINALLEQPEIVQSIAQNLHIPIGRVHALFFEVKEEGAFIATGLFHENAIPVSEDYVTNFVKVDGQENDDQVLSYQKDVVLGLRIDHPFI